MCIKTEGNKQPYMDQIKKYYASIAQMRERLKNIKEQLESSDDLQAEMSQTDGWLKMKRFPSRNLMMILFDI